MNNPFLSDRNIFSKVVNPLKKKSQTEAKDVPPKENSNKPEIKSMAPPNNYQPKYPLGNEKPAYNNNTLNINQPVAKMSFGKLPEAEQKISFNSKSNFNSKPEQMQFFQIDNIRESSKYDHPRLSENDSGTFSKNDYKSMSLENYQMASPNQDLQFEEYRKANNFKEYSPINGQVTQKLQDSQFLNIDAMGDDLNKFLASSKNQEELCKLLGINRQPKNPGINYVEKQVYQREPQRKKVIQNEPQARQNNYVSSNGFAKQKPTAPSNQYYQPTKTDYGYPQTKNRAVESQKQERDYIPTFNYMGLDEENETVSRQEDYIPRFKPISEMEKKQQTDNSKENIEVFNYSQANHTKSQPSIHQIMTEQMNSLCWNGKYRTFLTSTEKVVTVRYKMQML